MFGRLALILGEDLAVGLSTNVMDGKCSHSKGIFHEKKAKAVCIADLIQALISPLCHHHPKMDLERAVARPGALQSKKADLSSIDFGNYQQLKSLWDRKCSLRHCSRIAAQDLAFTNRT